MRRGRRLLTGSLRYPTLITALSALVAQACGETSSAGTTPVMTSTGGASGAGTGGAGVSAAGTVTIAGSINLGPTIDVGGSCASEDGQPLFLDQAVQMIGSQRVLYSWTTDEQVAELRAGGELFSRSEKPGMGRGLLFDTLATLTNSMDPVEAELSERLANEVFAKARFAWPNPWATLLGLDGEDYGTQLLRIELEPDAWIAHLDADGLSVFDADEQPVALSTALVSPERIGAIYFVAPSAEGVRCDTFSRGGVGYREFALGNLAMVARWSLATPEIKERLQTDIDRLGELKDKLNCQRFAMPGNWTTDLSCMWKNLNPAVTSLDSYYLALGLPNDLYIPTQENLEALLATLEMIMPTGEPLAVTPND